MNEMIINVIEETGEGIGHLEIEYEKNHYNILYYVDTKDEFHFFYENGNKPSDIDFEYKLICNL